MEKTPRGTGGRVGGVIAGKEPGKLSSRPLPWPHSRAEAGPGAPAFSRPPGTPRVRDPAPFPRQRRGPRGRRAAPTASPPGIETGPSGGRAPWRRAAVRSGEGARGSHSPGRSVGWLADPRGPRREGPAPRTPEPPPDTPRRRGGRPPRPGAESRLLHRSPPLLQESRRGDGEQLRAASRGFKDNNKKMATTQLLLRTPSPKVPPRPGRAGAGGGGQLSSCVRGLGRPPRPSGQRHNSARRGRRGESPGTRQARAPTARTHRVSGLRVHLAQVANHPNRFSWLRWAEARGSLALMAPRRRRRRRRRPAGSERRLGRSRTPLGLA